MSVLVRDPADLIGDCSRVLYVSLADSMQSAGHERLDVESISLDLRLPAEPVGD